MGTQWWTLISLCIFWRCASLYSGELVIYIHWKCSCIDYQPVIQCVSQAIILLCNTPQQAQWVRFCQCYDNLCSEDTLAVVMYVRTYVRIYVEPIVPRPWTGLRPVCLIVTQWARQVSANAKFISCTRIIRFSLCSCTCKLASLQWLYSDYPAAVQLVLPMYVHMHAHVYQGSCTSIMSTLERIGREYNLPLLREQCLHKAQYSD